jgi:hypothetical protein
MPSPRKRGEGTRGCSPLRHQSPKTSPHRGTAGGGRRLCHMNDNKHGTATPPMISNYLQRQAEVLLSLSRATFDLGLAGRLRALAMELRAKAQELDRDLAPDAPSRRRAGGRS